MGKYKCANSVEEIKTYIGNSRVVAFDFETAPNVAYRDEDKAALDPAKAHIVGCSFSVCEETNDVAGLVAMLRTLIRMVGKYQLIEEATEFFEVLLKEMLESRVLSMSQCDVLLAMVHESNQVLLELYREYQRSQDFEGLLGALLVLSSTGQKESTGVEELSEDDVILPTRDESIQIIKNIEELGDDVKSQAEKLLGEGNIDVVYAVEECVCM